MTTKSYFEKLEKQYGTLTFGSLLSAWRQGEEAGYVRGALQRRRRGPPGLEGI